MTFVKGKSGNPKGRAPILLPEVQRAVEANRNAVKVLILQKVESQAEAWIERIIEQGVGEGDVVRFKMLLEMAMGKMIEDAPEFAVSDEEKVLVLEYRRRKKEQLERDLSGTVDVP